MRLSQRQWKVEKAGQVGTTSSLSAGSQRGHGQAQTAGRLAGQRVSASAPASLREGLEETFTINRLGLRATLRRCLGTTNIVESPTAGVRSRTGRVTNWRNGQMVLRWAAAAYLDAEKAFNCVMGYRDLWMLNAALDEDQLSEEVRVA